VATATMRTSDHNVARLTLLSAEAGRKCVSDHCLLDFVVDAPVD